MGTHGELLVVINNSCDVILINSYTTISSFDKIVQETNKLASHRELLSEKLQGTVVQPLKQLMEDKMIEWKKVIIFWSMTV